MAGESFFAPTHDRPRGGIPADLIPYLEAGDAGPRTQDGTAADPQAEENERPPCAPRRTLKRCWDPDPILGRDRGVRWRPSPTTPPRECEERASHEAALAAEDDIAPRDARVQEIYQPSRRAPSSTTSTTS